VLLDCTGYSILYSEMALSRKPFGTEYMYVYSFVLRMTDTVNSDLLSSWGILYINYKNKY
jgi:hypothetical protein